MQISMALSPSRRHFGAPPGPPPAPPSPTAYFSSGLYTGTALAQSPASTVNLTTGGLVFAQETSGTGALPAIYADTVRGVGKYCANTVAAETADAQSLTAFGASSFSIGTSLAWNTSLLPFNSMAWLKAAGYLDIVAYIGDGVAGRTVSHSLVVAPEVMDIKNRTNGAPAGQGRTYCASLGNATSLRLTSNAVAASDTTAFNSTSPSSTVFTVGNATQTNQAGANLVAYLWASLPGYSKFGTFGGTGTTIDIACGFVPRFVMIKRTDVAGDWFYWSDAMGLVASGNNPHMSLSTTAAKVTTDNTVLILAAGFRVTQNAGIDCNVLGANYVYRAFA